MTPTPRDPRTDRSTPGGRSALIGLSVPPGVIGLACLASALIPGRFARGSPADIAIDLLVVLAGLVGMSLSLRGLSLWLAARREVWCGLWVAPASLLGTILGLGTCGLGLILLLFSLSTVRC